MTDPLEAVTDRLRPAFERVAGRPDVDPVVRPSDRADCQANGALALAKELGRNPRDVAAEIIAAAGLDGVADAELAGPGFINLTLRPEFVGSLVAEVATDPLLGIAQAARPERVVVDYSAPNVAKEMHIGHLRSTVIGDAVVRLFSAVGHEIVRENHIGDWGRPFGMLIEHLADIGPERAGSMELGDLDTFYKEATSKFEHDEAFQERARARVVRLQRRDEETMQLWHTLVAQSAEHWNEIYEKLGVLLTDADLAGESRYEALMPDVLERLDALGLLQESDGALVVFPPGFTNREGEPLPLIVRSRAGAFTYATSDLACVLDRVERIGATRLLYVVGAEQSQHLQMIFAVSEMAGWLVPPVRAEHVSFGLILGTDRRRLRSRTGEPARFIDVIDEAIDRGVAAVAEKNPELPEASAPRGGQGDRCRRGQVRRPLDRSRPRLRLRLGADALVRRQHGALSAVCPRQDLLDLPARGGRAVDRASDGADTDRTAGAAAGDDAARLWNGRRRSGRAHESAPADHATCTRWRRTSRRSTSTARSCGPPMPTPGRVAWR